MLVVGTYTCNNKIRISLVCTNYFHNIFNVKKNYEGLVLIQLFIFSKAGAKYLAYS